MKKEILLMLAVFVLMSLTAFTYAYATEEKDKSIVISKQTADVSGDGINETISLKGIPDPEPLVVESRFLNGYKAEILINETGKRYRFNLKSRKKYYEKLGLYHYGKLNEPTELAITPFSELKPVLLENEKMGLKGVQKVTGIASTDTIAYIESDWFFQGGKWNLQKAEVKKDKL